jgi:hypothetical protein
MLDRGETPRHWCAVATGAQRRVSWEAHYDVFAAWREMAQAMAASREAGDQRLSVEIVNFVRSMPMQQDEPLVAPMEPARNERSDRPRPDRGSQPDAGGPEVDR